MAHTPDQQPRDPKQPQVKDPAREPERAPGRQQEQHEPGRRQAGDDHADNQPRNPQAR